MLNILKNYWKSILFTLFIFYLSFAKPASFKDLNVINITDKTAHFLVYVAYGIVIIFDFIQKNRNNYTRLAFITFCIISPIMLGGLIEIIQEAFFKPRSSEWVDWLADIFGILTAWGIMSLLKNRTKYF